MKGLLLKKKSLLKLTSAGAVISKLLVNSSSQDREIPQQSCNFIAKLTPPESQIPKTTRETLGSSLSRGAQASSSHRG